MKPVYHTHPSTLDEPENTGMLFDFLESFGLFTDAEIAGAAGLFRVRSLEKGAFFIRSGEPCNEVAFICSGIFRSFYLSDSGEEITYCFRFPKELLAPYASFITRDDSRECLQAITPAKLLTMRRKELDVVANDSLKWTTFLKLIAEQEYITLEDRFFQLQRNSAVQRYRTLLEKQPEYIRTIPLQYLASYLGISQRHLSRIRREAF